MAYPGTNATVSSGADTLTLVGSGSIDSVRSGDHHLGFGQIATVTTDTVGAGGLAIAVATPTAEIDGATTTGHPGDQHHRGGDGGATSANHATIKELLVAAGIISGGIAVADATITGATGSGFDGSVTKSASVSVTSASGNDANATTTVVSGSLAAVAYSGTNATVTSGAVTFTPGGRGDHRFLRRRHHHLDFGQHRHRDHRHGGRRGPGHGRGHPHGRDRRGHHHHGRTHHLHHRGGDGGGHLGQPGHHHRGPGRHRHHQWRHRRGRRHHRWGHQLDLRRLGHPVGLGVGDLGLGQRRHATTTVVSGSLAAVAYSGTNATVGSRGRAR